MDEKKLSKIFCLLLLFGFSKAGTGEGSSNVKNLLKEIVQQTLGGNFHDARIATGCGNVKTMPNLDVKRLFTRTKIWYEMVKNETNPGKSSDCAKRVTMSLIGSQTTYFTFEYQNPRDGLDLWGTINTSDQNNTYVTIDKPSHLKSSTFYFLDTDYDNYTLLYSCSSTGKENFWILTGQKEPRDNLQALIQNAVNQQSPDFQQKLLSMNKCEEIHLLNTCRNKTNMEGLDLQKFSEELWFEQTRSSNDWEGNDICANLDFTYDDQKTLTVLYKSSKGDVQKYQAFNVLKNDNDLLLSTSDDNFFYYITDTDYKNYSVVYSCDQISKSEKQERLWILGKYNKIPEDIISAVSQEFEGISVRNITCSLPPPPPTTTTTEPATTTTQESVTSSLPTESSTQNDTNNDTTTSSEDVTTSNPDDGKGTASALIPCLHILVILTATVALLF